MRGILRHDSTTSLGTKFFAALFWAVLAMAGAAAVLGQDDSNYFIDAEVNISRPFVGQQMSYTLYGSLPASSPQNSILPDFAGFWRTQLPNLSRIYLFPVRAGQVIIAPTTLVFPETVFRAAQVLRSNEIVVQVQPLPDGAPAAFSGLVGQFEMAPTLDRQQVNLGDPLRLILTITGTGNLEQFAAPELPGQAGWRIYPGLPRYHADEQDGLLLGQTTFEWLITPLSVGQQVLPPLEIVYFDPVELAYRSLATAPVTFDVLPPANPQPTVAAFAGVTVQAFTTLKSISVTSEAGVRFHMVDSPVFWLIWLLFPLLAAAAVFWRRVQTFRRAAAARPVMSPALRRVKAQLALARREKTAGAAQRVAAAVYGYFGERTARTPRSLSQSDLRELMVRTGIDLAVIDGLIECLDRIDSARYGQEDALDVATLAAQALRLLTAVDRAWKP